MGGRGKCMFQMETNTIGQVSLSTMASSCVRQLATVSKSHVKQGEMAPLEELMTCSLSPPAQGFLWASENSHCISVLPRGSSDGKVLHQMCTELSP